jgi:inhibitor of KinA
MSEREVRIFPLGDSALTVEFGNSIDINDNREAIALLRAFEDAPFPGFVEAVSAYSSTSVFYEPSAVKKTCGVSSAFEVVMRIAEDRLDALRIDESDEARLIEIPTRFGFDAAIDLKDVAAAHGLSTDEVIEIFLSRTYRVFMIGFLPGFAYMGEVDDRIATPRKETPRTSVPKGSIGIAGKQTGIYSLESPGGWQIIGRTDLELFTPNATSPSLLQAGDQVRFTIA